MSRFGTLRACSSRRRMLAFWRKAENRPVVVFQSRFINTRPKSADWRPLRRWILRSRGRLLRSENRNEQEGSRQDRGRAQGRNRDRARRNKVGENSTCSPRWTCAVCRLSNHDAETRCHTNRTAQGSSIASDRQFRSRRETPSRSRLRPSW